MFACLHDYFFAGSLVAASFAFSAAWTAISCSLAILPPCLWNLRVSANSPSLWPTIFSVTNTDTCCLPLCTKKVNPTNSGGMLQARDQVLIWAPLFAFSTFFNTRWSMYGPFLELLLMGLSR